MQFVDVWSFDFRGVRNRWWAFAEMGKSELSRSAIPGLSFVKQLGTGAGNGFSIFPHWGRYVWVLVWEGEDATECARSFYSDHPVFAAHQARSEARRWWRMTGLRSHGTWNGLRPFDCANPPHAFDRVAVITRASIKRASFWRFWSRVSASARLLNNLPHLEWSVGMGELPLVEQATFSVWSDAAALDHFAYKSPGHAQRIKETHRYRWYSEEQFTRFAVLASGTESLPDSEGCGLPK